jgi:hypothetical protein
MSCHYPFNIKCRSVIQKVSYVIQLCGRRIKCVYLERGTTVNLINLTDRRQKFLKDISTYLHLEEGPAIVPKKRHLCTGDIVERAESWSMKRNSYLIIILLANNIYIQIRVTCYNRASHVEA